MVKLKITCKEATTICTKTQYGEASILDRFRLILHFLTCKTCRTYSKQNSQLSDMCKLVQKQKELNKCCLSDEDKARLKAQIKELEKKV